LTPWRARLELEELSRPGPGGRYWYSNGYNVRALIAVAVGVIPVLPGFINAAMTEGAIIADPNFFDELYKYGVFVACGGVMTSASSRRTASARSTSTRCTTRKRRGSAATAPT
jgi:cytosine/uracil/thiamine/allantoin permease